MRMTPSTRLNSDLIAEDRVLTCFSSVAASSGRNLYMKMKKPSEMSDVDGGHPSADFQSSCPCRLAAGLVSSATLAENRSARKPSVIA